MNLGSGQFQLGSLTGAVSSMWGALAVMPGSVLGCMLGHPFVSRLSFSVTTSDQTMQYPAVLKLVATGKLPVDKRDELSENPTGADHQQGSRSTTIHNRPLDPSTTARRASRMVGMVIQSDLMGDHELNFSAPSGEMRDVG